MTKTATLFGIAVAIAIALLPVPTLLAKVTPGRHNSLAEYMARVEQQASAASAGSPGSLWQDAGRFSNLAADYKANRLGDVVTILVAQDVTAQNSGSVATDRSFKASSGISAMAGHVSVSGVQNIFSPQSAQTLSGKAQAASTSSLRTSLAGRVVAVMPSGMLVVEAEREITMNNEHQTIFLRGLVRPGDIGPDNSVASNAIGNLELELKGKGVLSDGTRPPNPLVRTLLRIVGF
jgi:flagellar L-ring protein FlgH